MNDDIDGDATCAETGCTTLVPDAPGTRCGGPDGGPTGAGCGELFCGEHLYVTFRDGDLCAADYNQIEDRPYETTDEGCGVLEHLKAPS